MTARQRRKKRIRRRLANEEGRRQKKIERVIRRLEGTPVGIDWWNRIKTTPIFQSDLA